MKSNKKAESLIGIVIGVFILSIVLLGIGTLIGTSKDLIKSNENKLELDLLTDNTYRIIDKLDTSGIPNETVFYLYKNKSTHTFEIIQNEVNYEYRYVNKYGEKVDVDYIKKNNLYLRSLFLKRVIKNGEEKTFIKGLIKRANY